MKLHNRIRSLSRVARGVFVSFLFGQAGLSAEEPAVLVVTGGHPFDEPEFKTMVEEMDGIVPHFVDKEEMRKISAKEIDESYDALLLMDQTKAEVGEEVKKLYVDLTEEGVGMVFLHFTLASMPLWEGYHEIVGGKYHLKRFGKENEPSKYFPEMTVSVEVLDKEHPVTVGLADFSLTDAFYAKIGIKDSVKPLLGAKTPGIERVLAWENRAGNSKVIYLMPGFTKSAYTNDSYRRFVLNALKYVAE